MRDGIKKVITINGRAVDTTDFKAIVFENEKEARGFIQSEGIENAEIRDAMTWEINPSKGVK